MIQSLGASNNVAANSAMSNRPPKNDTPLTDDQATLISETLSEYDVNALTESDAQDIVAAFSEAGIEPGKALEEAMKESGFDAKNLGDLAGVGPNESIHGNGAPPPPQQVSMSSDMLDFLSEQLDKFSDDELTDENKESIMMAMQEEFGLEATDYLLNVQV